MSVGSYVSGAYRVVLDEHAQRGVPAGTLRRVAEEMGLALFATPLPEQLPADEGLALLLAYWGHLFVPQLDLAEVAGPDPGLAVQVEDAGRNGVVEFDVAQRVADRLRGWSELERLVLLARLKLALALLQRGPRQRRRKGASEEAPVTPLRALVLAGIVTDEGCVS